MLDLLLRKERKTDCNSSTGWDISYLQNCANVCLHCLIYQFRVLDFGIERMKLVPAYRQPCFLPTPPTPDGNIDFDLAAPEPATAASTPPTSC